MLSNAYFLAKLPAAPRPAAGPGASSAGTGARSRARTSTSTAAALHREGSGKLDRARSRVYRSQILQKKNAFESSRRDLQNALLEIRDRLWIPKRCKGVHCVDLGESFPTHTYLQNLVSTQPRTSPVRFAGTPLGHKYRSSDGGRENREGEKKPHGSMARLPNRISSGMLEQKVA